MFCELMDVESLFLLTILSDFFFFFNIEHFLKAEIRKMDFKKEVESSVLGTNSPLRMCVYYLIKSQTCVLINFYTSQNVLH